MNDVTDRNSWYRRAAALVVTVGVLMSALSPAWAVDPEDPDAPGRTYVKDGVVITVAARETDGATFVALGLSGADVPDN